MRNKTRYRRAVMEGRWTVHGLNKLSEVQPDRMSQCRDTVHLFLYAAIGARGNVTMPMEILLKQLLKIPGWNGNALDRVRYGAWRQSYARRAVYVILVWYRRLDQLEVMSQLHGALQTMVVVAEFGL